nr:site-specific integrase [Acidimicrobiia bacterium]
RFLTAEQVAAVAAAADRIDPTAGLVVEVLAWCGIRWGEMVALRRDRIDILRRRIDIREATVETSPGLATGPTKTYERRQVTMPEALAARLARHLADVDPDGHVFTRRGRPLRSAAWRSGIWRPALREAGIDYLRIHDLRHTAASLAIASGASIKAVQRQLGHASASMTLDRYGHLYEDDLDALGVALNERYRAAAAPPPRPHRAPEVIELRTTP